MNASRIDSQHRVTIGAQQFHPLTDIALVLGLCYTVPRAVGGKYNRERGFGGVFRQGQVTRYTAMIAATVGYVLADNRIVEIY